MANTADLLQLDDSAIYERNRCGVDLKGSIAIDDLVSGRETNFEIDKDSIEREDDGRYFDNEELFKQLNYECLDVDDGDSGDEKMTPFEKMKSEMENITNDGGVKKKIIKPGAGNKVDPGSLCRVHYNGYFEYQDEPYDSSRLRGRQQQFKLGNGEILAGWEIGIPTMKRGEIARFMLQPQYAYGERGVPPRIPAKSEVLFEIELISFVNQSASDSFANYSEEERRQASFESILKVADDFRSTGNEAFKLNQVARAAGKYSEAIRILENASLPGEEEEILMKKAALKLHLNLALCNLKMARSGRACRHARKALDIDRNNVKAFFRLSKALRQLGEYEDARKNISKAYRLDPRNKEIQEEMMKLDEEIQRMKRQDQALSRKMLNLNTNSQSKNVPSEEKKEKVVNSRLTLFIERLQHYKNTDDEKEPLIFPPILTEDELVNLTNEAKNMGLVTSLVTQEGKRSLKVTKH